VIPPDQAGRCGVRRNEGGRLALPFYGYVTALALDPIEKKPLYHFRPGSAVFSVGFAGCNLHCPFCQNWHISQDAGAAGRFMPVPEVVAAAVEAGAEQIAYTYSEPIIHAEYLVDCMRAARERGIANVLVTNGCAEAEAAADVFALCDAVNIDLKCFSAKTYAGVLGGDLEAVKRCIRAAYRAGVHVEVTTLVVPGLNDGEPELDAAADFLAETAAGSRPPHALGAIPWHLSAYHPDYRWKAPPTDAGRLRAAAERAREKLPWVYTGNTGDGDGFNDTCCPHCGTVGDRLPRDLPGDLLRRTVLVRRRGYRVDTGGMTRERGVWRCARCGGAAPFVG
jgi:pyruvate formate lyase activating enzyme